MVYTDIGKHTLPVSEALLASEIRISRVKDFIKARQHCQHEASFTTVLKPLLQAPASKNKLRFKSDIYFANAVNQESNPAVIVMTILLASPRKLLARY